MNQGNSTGMLLPLHSAVYPTMCEFKTRLLTYSAGWPSYQHRADPEDFAVAGLFYIGTSDVVKCFYCGGGLKNWRFDDSPYHEHARFYPSCAYIINKKGQRYVNAVAQNDLYGRLRTTQRDIATRQVCSGLNHETSSSRPNHITRFRDVVSPTRSNSKPSSSSRETLYQLEEEKLCKICHTRDNNVVLLPCAHFCCCMICSATIQKCPFCNCFSSFRMRK